MPRESPDCCANGLAIQSLSELLSGDGEALRHREREFLACNRRRMRLMQS